MSTERLSSLSIAIVGLGARFPGAHSLDDFWRNVREGRESLETFTDAELEAAGVDEVTRRRPSWVRRGTVLEGADLFDASFFGYSPREAQIIDPQHRVFLECAWEALEHAGYAPEPRIRVGVYAGTSINTYMVNQILANRALAAAVGGYQVMLGNDKDFLCTRVSYKLNLRGPSLTIQTACSTSLVAVQVACRALQLGECDMALAGGVSVIFPERAGYEYQEGMIFSPDGTCRPFDSEARGTRAGAGAGVVVLKRLTDALADGDTIHAVILGAAVNNDGAGKIGYTAPSVDGQVQVIAAAQALAGVPPRTISYIEAHGTATPLGDPIEIKALTTAFRASTDDRGFCAIGSVKANIGHLDAAAGVAGLIKTVLALKHREIPPLPHFRTPNPELDLPGSPFRVPTAMEPWASAGSPRRAGVSSFGIGGTNAHIVLEEAPAPIPSETHRSHHVVVLSARTPEALAASTANLIDYLRAAPSMSIADVAHTLQLGRKVFKHRRCFVARDPDGAIELLSRPELPSVLTGIHEGAARPVAFLFSGQGSQHAGMCRDLYRNERVFCDAFDRCADALRADVDCDLRDALRDGDDQIVGQTSLAQPLLFAAEYALAQLWMSWGVHPQGMLGHSVGEYVAAHLAGVFSLEDALRVVVARGRLMQAMPPGEMLAVSLPAHQLRGRLPAGVEIAAVNAPSLCTVSGQSQAVAALARELQRAGVEHQRLHTSHAFHSAMMEPALAPFRAIVAGVARSAPQRPYVSNVTGTWIAADQAISPDYYVEHLRRAVRFADGVKTLAADPAVMLLEVGPGHVLSSLARQSMGLDGAARVTSSLPHPRETRSQSEALMAAVARLWASGVEIDWQGLHSGERLRRVPLPTYPFDRKPYRVDAAAPPGASASSTRRGDLKDWFYVPSWARVPIAATKRRPINGVWLIFNAGTPLAAGAAARLRAAGAAVILVYEGASFSANGDEYVLQFGADEDYQRLFEELRRRRLAPRGILHLAATSAYGSSEKNATALMSALMALGRGLVLEMRSSPLRFLLATTGAQSVLGEPVTAPESALVTGPVLALTAEDPNLRVTAIDLPDPSVAAWTEDAIEALLDEATADDDEVFVARRTGSRWARRYIESALPDPEPEALPLKLRGVYLITGGTGGIGLTLARWLADRVQARVLLTARTPLLAREGWDDWLASHDARDPVSGAIAAVRAIEAAGGEVLVVSADIGDEAAMRSAVHLARERWGDVNGVIHSAGVPGGPQILSRFAAFGSSSIRFSSTAETDAVLRPKVEGTRVLTRLFATTPLDFFVAFSSISAVVPSAGSADYAAACSYLDAFVLSSHRPAAWRRVLAIAWDAWHSVGMAERVVVPDAMGQARRTYLAAKIAPAQGAEAFGRMLAAGLPQYVVSPHDIGGLLSAWRRSDTETSRAEAPPALHEEEPVRVAAPPLMATLLTPPPDTVEKTLASIWAELLGLAAVAMDDNFFELGGHSLLATRVLARIDRDFGVQLPLRIIFERPTIRELAEAITVRAADEGLQVHEDPAGDREVFEL